MATMKISLRESIKISQYVKKRKLWQKLHLQKKIHAKNNFIKTDFREN